jgi:hypothetical protein
MKRHIRRLTRSLSPREIAKYWSGSKVYREVARAYDLVYFGNVSSQDDEHEMVRGLTVSAVHQDKHYCVGTVEGYDVVLLERTDHLRFPGNPSEYYRWTILQVDLDDNVSLPHVFFDTKQHSSAFYNILFAKYSQFSAVPENIFADHDPKFIRSFTAYTTPDHQLEMIQLLRPEVTATMAHHFASFDFELFDDRVIVYSSNKTVSKQLIDHMIRAGVWLAREIESHQQ